MSNAIIERKKKLNKLIDNEQTLKRIKNLFEDNKAKAEKFKATILNVALDASLSTCEPASIVKSALQIAELDLPLAKSRGQAYIVKYKKDAEMVIGYKGWLAIARRCGLMVKVKPVFKCDKFNMKDNGFDETIEFEPNFDERKEYEPKWVEVNLKGMIVAIKEIESEIITITYVSFGKIKQITGKSPSKHAVYKSGPKQGQKVPSPYDDWNLEMYMGKAIKYVLSKTAMDDKTSKAVEYDNQRDIKAANEVKDVEQNDDLESLLQGETVDHDTGEVMKTEKDNLEFNLMQLGIDESQLDKFYEFTDLDPDDENHLKSYNNDQEKLQEMVNEFIGASGE
jgi:recombination protein RecT